MRTPLRIPVSVGLIVLALCVEARADIVNVQSILATEAEEGLSGAVTGSVDWRTGNSTRLLFSLAPVARYRTGAHLFIGLVSGEYYRDTDDLRFFEHVRYRYILSDRVLGEMFVQHERNDKRLLLLRAVVGAGPRFQLVRRDKLDVGLGVAYMFEIECLKYADCLQDKAPDPYLDLVAPEVSPALNHRLSSYLTGSYEIDERLQLVQTLYAQPRLNDLGDVRLLSESVFTIKLSQHLSFKTLFTLAWDSMPPEFAYKDPNNPANPGLPQVKGLDTALKSAITYDF